MIGTLTWVGHVTCVICSEQVIEIKWGEARKTLRSLGWTQKYYAGTRERGPRWRCPSCSAELNRRKG